MYFGLEVFNSKTKYSKKTEKVQCKKVGRNTSGTVVCVLLGEVLRVRKVFQPLHDIVSIPEKTVVYR